MSKKPTVRDIAKHANVAISTVSQVLNNKPGVAPDTRARVLYAANELGYKQRVYVNSALVPQIRTIALLTKHHIGDPVEINPFYSYVLAGAERECARHNGLGLMYANIQVNINVDENSHAESLPSIILDNRVDGAIIVGTFMKETITEISRSAGHNVVLVDSYVSGEYSDMLDSVLIDNYRGAYNAVSYLIANGHQHIGLIGSNPNSYPSILERHDGYLNALKDHNIREIHVEDSLLERSSAYEATRRLMRRNPQVTAIFACNDNVAVGAMNALHRMGYDIPGDVSIIGFDDIDLAQELTPALTTVHVDKVLLGAMAVRALLDRAHSPDRPGLTTMLGTQLILRESVRKLTSD